MKSDADLIRECLKGRQDAWAELVRRYSRLIYSIPRRYGFSDADADDVFQNVLETAFRKLDTLEDEATLCAWLSTVTHRECWRIGKKSGREKLLAQEIVDVGSPSDRQLQDWERQHLVHRGLHQLGGECERLLYALFFRSPETSYKDVAEGLGLKIGSIGPMRARCFEKLRLILQRLGVSEAG